MVRTICVVKKGKFVEYERPIISLNEFGKNISQPPYDEHFNAMTSNFNDLGYWNNEIDLNGKNGSEVQENLMKAISQIRKEGYEPYSKEQQYCYTWEFGREKIPGTIMTRELPQKDRMEILLFHLEDLLKISKKYDDSYEFFLLA